MVLDIIESGSKANCYILQNESEALILEAGSHLSLVKKHLNFNTRKVVGCLVTHEHGDHARSVNEFTKAGFDVYASQGTLDRVKGNAHRLKRAQPGKIISVGNFQVMPFDVKHDAAEPLGYLIKHEECGVTLFMTDTMYSRYTFTGLNNIIIEANYSEAVIKERMEDGSIPFFVKNRIIKSHLSFENMLKILDVNDLSAVNNIVLIHLSRGHGDEAMFLETTRAQTKKNVTIASAGIRIPFDKTPF